MDRGIGRLLELKRAGRRLYQSEEQFADMRAYFRHPDAVGPGQCASMERNLMVDMRGNVRLCFNMERIGLGPVANVREHRLRDLWNADAAERSRSRMRECREGCGAMVCHAR